MPEGIPVARQWVVVLKNGQMVIDWGNRIFQDIISGDFISPKENEISHLAQDVELRWLKKNGTISHYDAQNVFFFSLPELPHNSEIE